MSSSISSSEAIASRVSPWRVAVCSAAAALAVAGALEGLTRWHEARTADAMPHSVAEMYAEFPRARIFGREIGTQTIAHNVALFSGAQGAASVTSGYVGTSRSKVIRPEHFGIAHAANGSGNSYSEISFGLLLQAEALRHAFPNMKRVYIESSLLLRKPGRLFAEPDHRKYLPLLKQVMPLHEGLPADESMRQTLADIEAPKSGKFSWYPHLLKYRSDLRVSNYVAPTEATQGIDINADPLLKALTPTGERRELSRSLTPKGDQLPEIKADNIKVQRLRETEESAPWDGLYDMLARWGKAHDIEVVFYQPPVRSDLYAFQQRNGLVLHVADMQRVAKQYGTPFIDMNRPDLHFQDDWALFSDEDHLETCTGSGLLTLALEDGYRQFKDRGELLPVVDAQKLLAGRQDALKICRG
ncbi:hypothetical protein AB4120_00155 [Cupriavidus sp. 2KB_3]|uniref:hypothetical protein n=1 Tax=Cupriavidus sp. 2KB_3 TaxID=3232980 RepID=UPI003F91B66C